MNEVMETIKKRRSVRKFKSEMPKSEDINKIVEAGLYAPSGMNKQSSIAIVVTNKELRDKLVLANRKIGNFPESVDPFYNAPAIIIVLANKDVPTYIYDGSLMMENMMLEASELGLGSIWIHRAKEEFETNEFKNLLKELNIKGNYEGIGHLALGYSDVDSFNQKEIKDNRAYFVE